MQFSTVDSPEQLKLDWGSRQSEAEAESGDFDFPEFRRVPKGVREQSLRNAARLNAAHVSDDEYRKLLKERAKLVQDKFSGTLEAEGSARLEYVRWSLDRIEDAKHGYVLDRIEDALSRYRESLQDLQRLKSNLTSYLPKGRK